MDDWKKFAETLWLEEEDFYSHLNMEDITNAEYALLMVEKCIRGGICHSSYRYAKFNNKYMKYYDKSKESSYLQYWDVNNLCGWAIFQKLSVDNFEWIEDILNLMKIL